MTTDAALLSAGRGTWYAVGMISYRYTARNRKGELLRGALEAQDRAAALEAVRAKGLTPVQLEERPQGASLLQRPQAALLGAAVAVLGVGGLVLWWLTRSPATPPPPPEAAPLQANIPVPIETVPPAAAPAPVPAPAVAPAAVPAARSMAPASPAVRSPAVASATAAATTRRPPTPAAEPEPEPEPPKPAPFNTMTDQSLAMILSVPPGVEMAPLPDLHSVGLEDDLLKALQDSIVIEDDDSDELILRKDEVHKAKQQLVAAVAEGWTPAQVLHEYAQQHNEDASYRTQVVHAFQTLVREGKAGADHVGRELVRINAALAEYGLPPVTAEEIGLKTR